MEETKIVHKKKVLAPKLRFNGLAESWSQKLYGDIYSFYTTNSFSRDNLNYESGEVKNIHYGDIHTKFATLFDITKEQVPFVNQDIDLNKIKEENFCQEKDLVVADASEDYADIGKTIELLNLNNEKIIAGLHTFLARPNKYEMAKGFAGYLVKNWNFRKQVMTIAQGTKVLSLSTSRLGLLKLNIPSLPEQQKIAGFLSAVDEKIQQLNHKKQLLQQYKKGLMQQLFSGKLRFKDDTSTSLSAGNGKTYPKWEEKKLGEVGKFYAGGDLHKLDYRKQKDEKYIYPIYANGSGEGLYGFATTFQYKSNCVTVSGRGNLGYANVRNQNFNAIVRLIVIEPKDFVISQFLKEKINNTNFAIESTGVPQLTVPQISSYKILLPCLEEQKKIADFLSGIDAKINLVAEALEATNRFKKGLLQQLFV